MIQITNDNIKTAVVYHNEATNNWAMPLVKFHICLIKKIIGISSLPRDTFDKKGVTLSKYFGHDGNSLNSNAKIYLRQKRKKEKVNNQVLEKFITGKDPSFIPVQSRKKILRKCLSVLEYTRDNLEKVLIENPKELIKIHNDHYELLDYKTKKLLREILESCLDYEKLISNTPFIRNNGEIWNNYSITKEIGLKVCPYCNRNWIGTITNKNGEKIVNPQLDHYFDKAEHPLLRLSFFNLIPSCENCNSRLKGTEKFSLDKYLHPYMGGYEGNARFKVIPLDYDSTKGNAENYKVKLSVNSNTNLQTQVENSNKLFKIEEIYKHHGDVIADIYSKTNLTENNYLETLHATFKENIDPNKLYRIALGNYKQIREFHKRPFAKLTKDIAEDLGLI